MPLTKGFLSGLLLMLFGGGSVLIASGYRMGTAVQMGPGYFPLIVGLTVTAIGFVIAVRSFIAPGTSEPAEALQLRPMVLVTAAVIAFALLVRSWGLVLAIIALVSIGRLAAREGGPAEFVLMLVVLTALPVIVFVYGLNIPLQIWAW